MKVKPIENTIERGRKGEKLAEKLLQDNGWQIIEKGTCKTAWDLRIEKKGDVLAVNVKVGKKSYGMRRQNILRLIRHCVKTSEIPAFLFIIKNGYALFSIEEGKNLQLRHVSSHVISNYTLGKT